MKLLWQSPGQALGGFLLRSTPARHQIHSQMLTHKSQFSTHQITCLFISLSPHSQFNESRDWVLFVFPAFSTEHGKDLKFSEGFPSWQKKKKNNAGFQLCSQLTTWYRGARTHTFNVGHSTILLRREAREGVVLKRKFRFISTGNRCNQPWNRECLLAKSLAWFYAFPRPSIDQEIKQICLTHGQGNWVVIAPWTSL